MAKRKGSEKEKPLSSAIDRPIRGTATSQPQATREVWISFAAPEARAVSVVGEFNGWSPEKHPLQQRDAETWHVMLQLPPGTYQYKFVIDGTRWEEDGQNPKRTMNEFGTTNSILEVL